MANIPNRGGRAAPGGSSHDAAKRFVLFMNLPEKAAGRWGQGLTAEKMKECIWVKPRIVAEIECLEWTGADHLRHTKFVGLRDDKDPRSVGREI